MTVILNSTPLVALWSLEQLDLLRALYGHVLIPVAVRAEFLATETGARTQALDAAPWIKATSLIYPRQTLIYVGLDEGEASVLALAVERNARLVVIDERRGRRYAKRLGLPLTGTVGMLLAAKQAGHIAALSPLLNRLLGNGLYLSPTLVTKALQLAGEA